MKRLNTKSIVIVVPAIAFLSLYFQEAENHAALASVPAAKTQDESSLSQTNEMTPGSTVQDQRIQITDSGMDRTFEIARDEVGVRQPEGEVLIEKVHAQPTASEIVRYAEERRQLTGEDVALVLYEADVEPTENNSRILTRQVLIQLEDGIDPNPVAQSVGVQVVDTPSYAPGFYILEANGVDGSLRAAQALQGVQGVVSANPMLAHQQFKRLIPNDTLFGNQWHLRNTGQTGGTPGMDVNVVNVWDTYLGAGVTIGIVDDGLQVTHPDLSPNVNTTIDFDFNGNDTDPSPGSGNNHGTAVGGVSAARGNNGLGVSGVAPFSTLVGLRLIGGPSTDATEANAFNHEMQAIHLKNNSWGPSDNGMTLEGPGPLATAALANSAQNGRNGLGTIFVWAGGNGLGNLDNQNYDGYVNSIYTVSVGAVTHTGTQSSYSERGACMLVSAPSSAPAITTTDIVGSSGYSSGDYTSTFGGTSSASPAAAGTIALVLQANPNLGWRDVQEILVQSSRKNQPGDTGWFNNGAGFHFNHKFGFGLIDTQAAVALGSTWANLEPQTSQTLSQTGLGLSIPDNNPTGVSRTFDFSSSAIRVEHVTVTANISHTSRGNLEITLTSPSGTVSRLAEKHNDTGDNYSNWTFMSVANWGESSTGTWTVKVADLTAGTTGTLNSLTVKLYGTGGGGGNQPPIANAGPDQTVTDTDGNGSESVTLSGSGSTDSDGTITSYVWTEGTTQIATGITPVVTLGVGSHNITLTVTDNGGATATDSLNITVNSAGGGLPAAPSNLSAVAASSSQINLSWTDNSSNETGFKIERRTRGSFVQIATVGANVTTYNNTGLSAGTKYFYRVRATNASGDSTYSNTATVTTP